jgi:restriction endonuclease S subunit
LKKKLSNITKFQSGIYKKPDINADTLYLQSIHFDRLGRFDKEVSPQLKLDDRLEKYLLKEGDLLFVAKGLNNFAVVYHDKIGNAVASSSFIVIKINEEYKKVVEPNYIAWFLTHHKHVKMMHKQLGTTIPSISMRQLAELEIDIPPIEVQKKIVAIHQLREKEKEINSLIEEWKDKEFQILLSNATQK